MSKALPILLFLSIVTLYGCIENDFIDDRVNERISLSNTIDEILLNETHQLTVTFFNNVGIPENRELIWSSLHPSIISVSNAGLISALNVGNAIIRVESTTSLGVIISEEIEITVSTNSIDNPSLSSKSGTIITTSSYLLEGSFIISEILNSQNLDLSISDNYNASTSLPGLYIYLSNNPSSVSGALELGKVTVFSGAHNYIIENIEINNYKYVLYWCKPFSVKVGHGEID
jgi:hypothetical protein